MNKKLVESLVKSGACDDFGPNRAELAAQVDGALAQASVKARDREAGQASLLDLLGPMEPATKKNNGAAKANAVPEWSLRERLGYEKELLGFYITGHPLDEYAADLAAFQVHTVAQLKEIPGEVDSRICGIITKLEIRLSQKDKTPWAKAVLEDMTGSIEFLVFQPLYGELARPLAVGEIVVISGSLSRRDDQPALRAAQVLWLPEAHDQLLRELVLHLSLEDWLDPARWIQLRELGDGCAGAGEIAAHLLKGKWRRRTFQRGVSTRRSLRRDVVARVQDARGEFPWRRTLRATRRFPYHTAEAEAVAEELSLIQTSIKL